MLLQPLTHKNYSLVAHTINQTNTPPKLSKLYSKFDIFSSYHIDAENNRVVYTTDLGNKPYLAIPYTVFFPTAFIPQKIASLPPLLYHSTIQKPRKTPCTKSTAASSCLSPSILFGTG